MKYRYVTPVDHLELGFKHTITQYNGCEIPVKLRLKSHFKLNLMRLHEHTLTISNEETKLLVVLCAFLSISL